MCSTGRMSTGFCRLCHGKFSTRRLRQAFAQLQGESCAVYPLFCTDFQQLLGIPMNRDPSLSQFICNNCHAQFYKCHSILLDFRNRVNLTPVSRDRNSTECSSSQEDITLFRSHITSDRRCLHGLVSWAHSHAEGCHSCPDLQEVLEGQCRGALKVMWGCVDGHTYVMDTNGDQARSNAGPETTKTQCDDRAKANKDDHQSASRTNSVHTVRSGEAAAPQNHSSDVGRTQDMQSCEEPANSVAPLLMDGDDADSDLSDRNVLSDEECEERRKSGSSEDSSDLNTDKRCLSSSKKKEAKTLEPKTRRKPGPKPGWKNNIKAEREELPTIYKCPHQGCTAVYRGADGMKKHIKEHHEEVRERPCPHPGCNKVFMIDRYLQRHVKLIHTEVRNYICDQCGQTFKQRKHLSVHQMRHSGAKPLQCEVCGFQCRQRASLKYHMTKHKAEADLEFACVICSKRFEKAHNLNVHMSMVHPLLQGAGASVPPDSSASSPSAAQHADFRSQQTRADAHPSDLSYVLDSLQSKLTDSTV
ncbi:zinc finger protein 276 isoform X2 [Sinocyclocheilus anshuiensis]|uniref:zinc finger protein 276 isoform X2 n=1 Tax=Sinocyclocheilus anshuiensis TaxID=1608454 RepID=UPI0007B9C570|nr:PREDICTED: zinc finger protein 276 isoform X2 [Sinocyclocheilus anshuiensis]